MRCSAARSRFAYVSVLGAALLLVVGLLAVFPVPAHAFGLAIPDSPQTIVAGEYTSWIASAQGLARNIYVFLLTFELIALGVTTLLFRENLGEFFSSVGLKILVGGIFFWFIANGPALASSVINWFIGVGTNYGGTNPLELVAGCFAAAYAFFTAADMAHSATQISLVTLGLPPSCVWIFGGIGACPVAPIAAASNSHPIFVLLAQGLGLMIMLATAGIVLQFAIITIESYLVMSVGILYIGFAGSRFTMPFSQGYFSYMVNVGTKLMVTYIMLGIAQKELFPILAGAGIALLGSSMISMGFSDAVAIAGAAMAAVYIVLTMGLIWTIPAFTAALLSGQSQSSGFAILQQALGSFAGAAQMMSQFGAAKHSAGAAKHERAQMAEINGAHAAGAGGAYNASGYTSQTMAPGGQVDHFKHVGASGGGGASGNGGAVGGIGVHTGSGSGSAQLINHTSIGTPGQQSFPSGGAYGGSGSGPVNPSTGMSYDPGFTSGSGGENLYNKSVGDIRRMDAGEFQAAFANTDYSLLDKKQQEAVNEFHSQEASQLLGDKADASDRSADLNRAYGLSGLAQVAQREIGQPSAVQARISNPDKL